MFIDSLGDNFSEAFVAIRCRGESVGSCLCKDGLIPRKTADGLKFLLGDVLQTGYFVFLRALIHLGMDEEVLISWRITLVTNELVAIRMTLNPTLVMIAEILRTLLEDHRTGDRATGVDSMAGV